MLRCHALHRLWQAASLPAWRRFRMALRQPAAAQQRVLHGILQRNVSSDFGRRHRFGQLTSVDEFRRRVPLRTFEDFAADVERVARGEPGVLTAEPVRRLVPTRGSSGGVKLIPFTDALGREFRAAIGPWVAQLFFDHPAARGGPAYWSISPAQATLPPLARNAAVPVGFDSDSAYLGRWAAPPADATLAVRPDVRDLSDVDAFVRATAAELLRCADLRLVSVWRPTYFTLLTDHARDHWDDVLRAIHEGTATPRRSPNPRRARVLARLGPSSAASWWPRLAVVSARNDAAAATPARQLQQSLPHAALQPKGLLATEGVVTIPFAGTRPAAVTSHFLEFIRDDGVVCGVGELERGATYEVAMTTGGGLYRYRLGDRVEVENFADATPCLKFLGRAGGVDLCGEKLTEAFVASMLQSVFADAGLTPSFAMLAPQRLGRSWRYVLFLEGVTNALDLTAPLDAALSANLYYHQARRCGQLDRVGVRVVDGVNAPQRYLQHLAASDVPLGQIKLTVLSPRTDWGTVLASAAGEREPGIGFT